MKRGSREIGTARKVALSEVNDDLSKYLRLAEKGAGVITRHGKPAAVLIGFESGDDWFKCRLANHPCFQRRIRAARRSVRAGRGVRLEDVGERLHQSLTTAFTSRFGP